MLSLRCGIRGQALSPGCGRLCPDAAVWTAQCGSRLWALMGARLWARSFPLLSGAWIEPVSDDHHLPATPIPAWFLPCKPAWAPACAYGWVGDRDAEKSCNKRRCVYSASRQGLEFDSHVYYSQCMTFTGHMAAVVAPFWAAWLCLFIQVIICERVYMCVYVCIERRQVGIGDGHKFIKKAERITRMGERQNWGSCESHLNEKW